MYGFFKAGSPFIEISIEGRKIETLVDTGFNGHLMLPLHLIGELGLDLIGISDYLTASGDKNLTKVYKGKLNIFNDKIEVPILSTNSDVRLAGMELFSECKLIIEKKKDIVEVFKSK